MLNESKDCYLCGGTGHVECHECLGTGSCWYCRGTGYENGDYLPEILGYTCRYCVRGECALCNGTGKEKCTLCHGTGY